MGGATDVDVHWAVFWSVLDRTMAMRCVPLLVLLRAAPSSNIVGIWHGGGKVAVATRRRPGHAGHVVAMRATTCDADIASYPTPGPRRGGWRRWS